MSKRFNEQTKIAIVGAGEFGSYIAWLLNNSENVYLYDVNKEYLDILNKERIHPNFPKDKPEYRFSKSINVTNNLEECVKGSEIIFVAVPAQLMRGAVKKFRKHLDNGVVLINVAKALEQKQYNKNLGKYVPSNKRMDEVFADELHGLDYKVVVIAGGMIAREGIMGNRLSADIACESIGIANNLRRLLGNDKLRLKPTKDIIGVELAGALKNVYAIGIGIYRGISKRFSYGDGINAALISESAGEGYDLAERYAEIKGVKILSKTYGPRSQAWYGDLLITGLYARNGRFGEAVGLGIAPEAAKESIGTVEGYPTVKAFYNFLKEEVKGDTILLKKELSKFPIFSEIHDILYKKKSPIDAMNDLMNIPDVRRRS